MRPSPFALVLLSLAACSSRRAPTEEQVRRDAFVESLIAREHTGAAHGVSSRPDVRFEWGFSVIEYDATTPGEPKKPSDDDPPKLIRSRAYRWMGQHAVIRVKSHGDKPMHLKLTGWVSPHLLRTMPTVTLYVDGQYLAYTVPVSWGGYGIEVVVPREMLAGADWVTLDLQLSSIGWHWAEPPGLQVALVDDVEWSEAE